MSAGPQTWESCPRKIRSENPEDPSSEPTKIKKFLNQAEKTYGVAVKETPTIHFGSASVHLISGIRVKGRDTAKFSPPTE
jgi:hypothetical protein